MLITCVPCLLTEWCTQQQMEIMHNSGYHKSTANAMAFTIIQTTVNDITVNGPRHDYTSAELLVIKLILRMYYRFPDFAL